MFVDLHLHTTYSDGSFTPKEVIKKAKEIGYSAIAITDHDTTEGLQPALNLGEKHNLEVIPGIEFNTSINGIDVHILGYFINQDSKCLNILLEKIKKERRERIEKMIELLKELYGYELSLDEIKEVSEDNIIGRAHIARLLLLKGYVDKWEKVFDNYIGRGRPAYISRSKITPFKAIDVIKKAEGVPVIAHPGLIENNQIVKQLINYGVTGLEVFYLEHTQNEIDYYKEVAKNNELLITGGSDCHGPNNKDGLRLGQIKLDYGYLQELKNYKSIVNDRAFKKDLLS